MKTLILILLLALANPLSAQEVLDTIYANEHKNVALFFPSPIRKGIVGASHFVFTYNREMEQHFGLLQARPYADSNLLALTKDGWAYSYVLKYGEQLNPLNRIVVCSESIGTEKPIVVGQQPTERKLDNISKRITYFEGFCNCHITAKNERLTTKRKGVLNFS